MKLTKQNLKRLEAETSNKLTKHVITYVIDKWDDYEDKNNIFTDVLYHGCQSGVVSHLIYYVDTVAFYEEYKEEINSLLKETMDSCGIYDFKQLFGDKYDEEDPLIIDTYNQNLFAWFGFEEALRNLAYNFEQLEDLI